MFSKLIHDLVLPLNFLCVTYSVLSCKLVTAFFTFPIFIVSGKNGKSLWNSCIFILHQFLHYSFLWNLQMEKYLLSNQNYLLEAFATLHIHINYLHPNIEDMTIFFIIIFHVFVIRFCISINRVTYSSSNTLFYH